MSHQCPILCKGCAIKKDIFKAKYKLNQNEILTVLKEAKKIGIKNYSLTGGEPFLDLTLLKNIINLSPLDLVKINTNAFIFSSPQKTKDIYRQLLETGFSLKNKHISSWLNLSVGQQTLAGVPLENAIFACRDFYNFFSEKKAGISLLVFCLDQKYSKDIIEKFINKYEQISGHEFDRRIPIKIIPSRLNECSTALKLNQYSKKKIAIKTLIKHYLNSDLMINCTPPDIQYQYGIIAPRILVRADGSVYSCYGFGHVYNLGNIKKESLKKILQKINSNIALKTVLQSGLMGLLELANKYRPRIGQERISDSYGPCDICQYLNDIILSNCGKKQ